MQRFCAVVMMSNAIWRPKAARMIRKSVQRFSE